MLRKQNETARPCGRAEENGELSARQATIRSVAGLQLQQNENIEENDRDCTYRVDGQTPLTHLGWLLRGFTRKCPAAQLWNPKSKRVEIEIKVMIVESCVSFYRGSPQNSK